MFWWLLAVFLVHGAAQPLAVLVETRSPHISGVQPSCSPGVTPTGHVFACYKTPSTYYAASMAPSGTSVLLTSRAAPYVKQPLVVYNDVAIFYDTLHTRSFYAVVTERASEAPIDRHGITAGIALVGNVAAVPLGTTAIENNRDFLQGVQVGRDGGASVLFDAPVTDGPDVDGTAVTTPVVWNGKLVMTVGDSLQMRDASTGSIIRNITNPCGLFFQPVQGVAVAEFHHHGAAVSMLIVYGNTTNEQERYSFCSIDPVGFTVNWHAAYPDIMDVDDVAASAGVILVSGTVVSAGQLLTWSIDAFDGTHLRVITKQPVDIYAWPVFLPSPISECNGTFIMQSGGLVSAYCTDTMEALWTQPYHCSHRATIDAARNRLVCTHWGRALTMLDFDGGMIWHDTRVHAEYQVAMQGGLVYAIDGAASLWVLSYSPAAPEPTPEASGLSGGEVFLIVFGIMLISASIVGASLYYKRAIRRSAHPARIDAEGYGSLTT